MELQKFTYIFCSRHRYFQKRNLDHTERQFERSLFEIPLFCRPAEHGQKSPSHHIWEIIGPNFNLVFWSFYEHKIQQNLKL